MPKVVLNRIENLQNETSARGALNENFRLIKEAIDNSLSRDGSSPNRMRDDLDMDGNRILHLPLPVLPHEAVPLAILDADASIAISGAAIAAAQAAQAAAELAVVQANDAVDEANAAVVEAQAASMFTLTRNQIATTTISASVEFITTSGYANPGDLGGGRYDRVVSEPSHAGKVQSLDGAWWALVEPEPNVHQFGAVGDAAAGGTSGTDDTTAFNNAIAYVSTAVIGNNPVGGGVVRFFKRYLINSTVDVKPHVTLRGPVDSPGITLPIATASPDTLNGVLYINSSATLNAWDCSCIEKCYLVRKGLVLPFASAIAATAGVAAFAGNAITIQSHDVHIRQVQILGFATGVISNSGVDLARPRLEYVTGDCTNGIHIYRCFDVQYIDNCHFWPYTTTSQAWTTDTLLTRAGTAYFIEQGGDWSKFTNCFSFGYLQGFLLDNCDNAQLIGCGADYPGGLSSSSFGYIIRNGSVECLLLGCQAAANGVAVRIETLGPTSTGGSVRIQGCSFWDQDTTNIDVLTGRAIIIGNIMRGGTNGVNVTTSSSSRVLIEGNEFDTVTNPIVIAAPEYYLSTIGHNDFFNCTDTVGRIYHYSSMEPGEVRAAFRGDTRGTEFHWRKARGSPTAITAASIGDNGGVSISSEIWNGSAFSPTAQMRAVTGTGAGSGGSVSTTSSPGSWIWATTSNGAITATDRTFLDSAAFGPITNNALTLGTSALKWSTVHAVNCTLTGDLSCVNATLTGNLGAVGGTFSGSISAVNATLSGNITSAVNATLTGGLRVGFAGTPTADRIEFGDANANLDFGSGTPAITFDTGDYWRYDRTNNQWIWAIGSADLYVLANNQFFPNVDNTSVLGNNGKRWTAVWAANGTIQTSTLKSKDILGESLGLDFIKDLKPISYKYKDDHPEAVRYGLVIEDVRAALKGKTFTGIWADESGEDAGMNYSEFIAPLIAAVQALAQQVDELKAKIANA